MVTDDITCSDLKAENEYLRMRLAEAEETLRQRLEEFEESKAKENNKIQSELERLTAQYMARIQGNVDEVAREEDEFRDWQRRKQVEAQRIAEAATLCLPAGSAQNTNNLTLVLERAAAQHRSVPHHVDSVRRRISRAGDLRSNGRWEEAVVRPG